MMSRPHTICARTTIARAILLALPFLAAACSRAAPPPAAVSTGVTLTASDVAQARVASLTDAVSISGSLEPAQTVVVKSQINAIVRAVHADRGSRVQRGEVLIELDAQGLRGQAAGAKAAIAAADANLSLATQRLESARRLHAAGGISDFDLKTVEAARQVAEAQAAGARAQWATSSESESRATIVSPIEGIVSDRAVEAGEAVREGGVLLTVVETRTLELRAQVGVDEAMRVKPGATVVYTLDAAPGETFSGRVTRVDPRADPATRRVGVASTLSNADRRIVAGQFAHGRVLTGAPSPQVVVPVTAVSDSAGFASVFVIQNGRLARRAVVLGVRDDAQGLVAVRSGLNAGEHVLAVPVLGAAEGLSVAMATDSAAPRPGTPQGKPR
jgi:RND family efflux transporter MFP subunit